MADQKSESLVARLRKKVTLRRRQMEDMEELIHCALSISDD